MRPDERVDSLLVAMRAAIKGAQPELWTALPGIVQSFDPDAGTCSVQPAVQARVTDKDGKSTDVSLPVCVDVTVQFSGGGGYVLTFPLASGDEGLIVFSCRCIDAWWQQGGVQPQAELRMHDLSDGFFLPGFRSQARRLNHVNTQFPELRNEDGSLKIQATLTGFRVEGTLEVSGDLMLGGVIQSLDGGLYQHDLVTQGEVVGGSATADQVSLRTHKHPGNNQPPIPGS